MTRDILNEIIHMAMPQFSLKVGIEKFGADADKVVIDEFSKLHMMDTFAPERKDKLTREERKQSLRTIMFIKQKRDGTLRGRTCGDGSVQRKLYDKSEC